MDPKANVAEQQKIARRLVSEDMAQAEVADLAIELAELVIALDEWRRNGGFDPYIETRADSLAQRSAFLERERKDLGNQRRN